jgi:hypothetical protein
LRYCGVAPSLFSFNLFLFQIHIKVFFQSKGFKFPTILSSLQIRLQLETLLTEKSRLAHENSVYARENRFLREIVEYHQLTMQDVIYVDEGIEEVTEVYPTQVLPPVVASNASKKSQKGQSTPLVVPDACTVVPISPKDAL